MELYPAEIQQLNRLVEEWSLHDQRELEATFKDASDTTAFLEVARRLKAKGFTALPQEDKMNILTQQHVRFTLTGLGAIESYCRDDTLVGKPYEAMVKDRTGPENNLDLEEYGVRIKVRRELPIESGSASLADMLTQWPSVKKAFRIIRRWSFVSEEMGVRFDLSMVKSTPKDAKGGYKWQTGFKQRDITREAPAYEIEVELLRPKIVDPAGVVAEAAENGKANPIVTAAVRSLVRGIGEVLRGIQKHSLLIRKSVKEKVLDAYKALVKTDQFRGVAPLTMVKENMIKERKPATPNIRDGYNVTDKADGLRMMAFTDSRGELFMLDMSLNVYRTGLMGGESVAGSLLDGEFVTRDKKGRAIAQLCLFDCYIAPGGKDVTEMGFAPEAPADLKGGRYEKLVDWVEKWNAKEDTILAGSGVTERSKIQVLLKKFLFAAAGDQEIFDQCRSCLDGAKEYHTDGLILTPIKAPLPQKPGVRFDGQMKWKPSDENTVDFLGQYDKDLETRLDAVEIGVKPGSGETVQYKTLRLYVGSSRDPAYENPRGTVLYEQPLPGARGPVRGKKREYKPVVFNPTELPDTMASVCYLPVEVNEETGDDVCRCENGDPVQDRSIIEMRYEPKNEPGWRWIPMRIRYDKTERFQKGILGRTLNKDEAAEGVWESIHDPITLHMIRTGSEKPSEKELEEMSASVSGVISGDVQRVYYDRKEQKNDIKLVSGLREFHRRYVKEKILLGTGLRGGGRVLVDLACGQGGDLWSWVNGKASFVYGTDIAGFGITDPQDGAYRRYLNAVMKYGGYDRVPRMVFTIGSSAKVLVDGTAGATPEESNIMRAVYGQVAPDGPVPKFVEKYGAGRLKRGADCVAIMFAIHYFFENEGTLNTIMRNISDSLALGGLFIGCCFDGQKIFDAFQRARIPDGGSLVGKEGDVEIWKITRRFPQTEFTVGPESLGMPIDVQFISIGTEQREFLVNFETLKMKMEEIGCDLLTKEECGQLGLANSTELFEDTWEGAKRKGDTFPMNPKVKQYSFFNRWFIFKRRRGGVAESATELVDVLEGEEEAAAAVDVEAVGAVASSAAAVVAPAPAVAKKTPAERQAELRAKLLAKKAAAGEEGAAAAAPLRTVGVAEPGGPQTYEKWQIFKFYPNAPLKDELGLKDPAAARWLSPISPFPIKDRAGVEYPSLEHYIAAMKFVHGASLPDVAKRLFGDKEGTIPAEFRRIRATESGQGARALTIDRDLELTLAEQKKVREESLPAAINKKYGGKFDERAWLANKDEVLLYGLKQRWDRDAKLRRAVEAAKNKGLTLLYYTGTASGSNLGGKVTAEKTIDGDNKIGKILMMLAGFNGYEGGAAGGR